MVTVEEFIDAPSEELLSQCTKDQLLKIAEHYNIEIEPVDKRLKETLFQVLRENLFKKDVPVHKGQGALSNPTKSDV